MPTQPAEEIIPRELSSEAKKLLDSLSSYCSEIVNFGSQVLKRCARTKVDDTEDHYLTSIMFLRHTIDIIDSIAILISVSSVDPCKILLRSLLETVIEIEWMVAERFEDRSKAYVIWKAHHDLKLLKKLDIRTPQGKQFYDEIERESKNDLQFHDLPFEKFYTLKENLISAPSFARAEEEYKRITHDTGKPPRHWYSMFPSSKPAPQSMESLSKQVGRFDEYEFLYRTWSEATHGEDVIAGKITQDKAIYQIRFLRMHIQLRFIRCFWDVELFAQWHQDSTVALLRTREAGMNVR